MKVELGNGDIEIVTIHQGGRVGVLLRKESEAHEIGEFTGTGGQEYVPTDADVVIWLNRLESARILQDTVNQAVLIMLGVTTFPLETIERIGERG